ncbi:MAG: NAD-binding protein [Sedimentisphaerales bacterium]|nr:NAD-binding protein [Sedimentisphaerales bacterium]
MRSTTKHFSPLTQVSLAVGFLVLVVAIGTMGFVLLEDVSILKGLYITLITISTLGMMADSGYALGPSGQLLIMFLIVVGIGAGMIALTTIVSTVVEGHIRSVLGRRKVDMKISSLTSHIIVCGYGRMGRSLCENLKDRKSELVVIEQDDNLTALAEQDGLLYILGDATEETILQDAGIQRARGLVAALGSDAANVFTTLVARDLNPDIFITARAEKTESISRLIRAGADNAICPQVIGATRMANILTRPGVVEFLDFAAQGLELEAEQFKISSGSQLVGKTLRQANLPREVGVLVIALKRKDDKTVFNPDPDTELQEEDVMIVTGQVGSMAKLGQLYS